MSKFELISSYQPKGDQPSAIDELSRCLDSGKKDQVLLGVTGSGKTFTIANVIQRCQRPTLVLSHNKTLAAQLYGEFKYLFPNNAVEYFISYYDYYQPEAYIPGKDIYIEKDADINDKIEMLRLHTTMSLALRRDVIVVASVSCIYGLGIPEDYHSAVVVVECGKTTDRDKLISSLIDSHYERNDYAFQRGAIRVKGETLEVYPAYLENSLRIDFSYDVVDRICRINPLSGEIIEELKSFPIYPANHFITSQTRLEKAIASIKTELATSTARFKKEGKLVEAQRLEQRTLFDIEMLREIGYCSGIENYSYHLTGGKAGETPKCLIDYFPKDFLTVVDESHASIPQVRSMYAGDYSRKKNLVEFGFRLPSAFENRPLRFGEFEKKTGQTIYVSATPADYELDLTAGEFVEQVIRPTGLLDPEIEIKPVSTQVDDLLEQIRQRVASGERTLVTTLTKKMSEDLTEYLVKAGVKARWLHSEIGALERSQIIRELRMGKFDVLVGINLLREGLDMPEVSLVAILDADKAGFLRSERSLIQTAGRAARNTNGKVIFYADVKTAAIKTAASETNRRRAKQIAYNKKFGITPLSISKSMDEILASTTVAQEDKKAKSSTVEDYLDVGSKEDIVELLHRQMKAAASKLDFEKAMLFRDRLIELGEIVK